MTKCVMKYRHYDLSNLLGSTRHGEVRGGVVVKALRYKPAGRGFDS